MNRFMQGECWLFVMGALVLATLPAAAQGQIADSFTVFDATGFPFTGFIDFEGAEGTVVHFLEGFGNPAQYGNYTVLTEPDGSISDVFGVVPNDLGSFDLAFISDGETGLPSVPAAFINRAGGTPTTMAEGNGGPFDATKYLSPTLQAQGITATFQSDAEGVAAGVPEPGSFVLLGLGGLGLIGYGWRRRQTV